MLEKARAQEEHPKVVHQRVQKEQAKARASPKAKAQLEVALSAEASITKVNAQVMA